jgi:hypothetical protein
MNIYQVRPIGAGVGFKVQMTGAREGLRVVGIFPTEADATAWIAGDKAVARRGFAYEERHVTQQDHGKRNVRHPPEALSPSRVEAALFARSE